MYAIIKTGGKQYKVEKGSNLVVDKIDKAQKNQEIVLKEVLLLSDEQKTLIGKPIVEGITVTAKVISQKRAPKILVFKKKPKKGYKKLQGHRQYLTELEITGISV
ncbi:MAG: 50S ribosomal protein L21 [Endomicrobium sp.]|jgi:large subunit ribosomal protein L21|nr:50S ribosomal protein L21 [Endomicrobium sp.]